MEISHKIPTFRGWKTCHIFQRLQNTSLKPTCPVQHFIADFHRFLEGRTNMRDKPRQWPLQWWWMLRFLSTKIPEWHCRRKPISVALVNLCTLDLQEKLVMSKASDGWMLKQLTEDQKAFRVTIAKEIWSIFVHDENKFLNCIVTADEMWDHYAKPKPKA